MRTPTISVVAFALLACSASAQDARPWEFYPLNVGDAWEYTTYITGEVLRVHIERDTVLNEQEYVIWVRSRFSADGNPLPPPYPGYQTRFAVRYDTASSHVMAVYPSTGEESVFGQAPCEFSGEDGESVDCPYWGGRGDVFAYTDDLVISDTTIIDAEYKIFGTIWAGAYYVRGIGEVEYGDKDGPARILTYCRVNGVEYGEARFPVTVEGTSPVEGASPLALGAWPNPFTDRLSVSYDLPSEGLVRLSLHDMLGREVRVLYDRSTRAGPHLFEMEVRGLAPGLYLLRLMANAEAAPVTRPVMAR